MNFAAYLLMIRTFLSAVKTVEALMPNSKGKEKFDAAIVILESVIGKVESYAPALKVLATLAVTTFRATKEFQPKPAA